MGVYAPGDHLYYNDNDLTGVQGLTITQFNPYQLPQRTMEAYPLARAHGNALVSAYFDCREIKVLGVFTGNSKASFETARDTLLSYLAATGGRLEGMVAGSLRRFYVTLSDAKVPENYGGYAQIELTFEAYDPFGYSPIALTPSLGATFTANNTSSSNVAFSGTFDAAPVITATINTLTASGQQSVTIANPATGITATITRIWTGGDIIVMDAKGQSVTVNGIQVPWTGGMPTWPVGTGNVKWSDTFSARNVSWSLSYNPRYL